MNAMNLATTMVDQRGKWAHQAANFPLKPLRSFRPPSKIGQYELLEPLGSGATLEVHLAIAPDMTAVALKMVPKQTPTGPRAKSFAEILHQESQILTKLDHPAIPSLHDSDKDEGFLALQLVFGKTVEQMMDQASGSTFPADTVLKIMKGVLEGLEHAHEKGIVHRDIKPGNVMISDRGEYTSPIGDWGWKKAVNETVREIFQERPFICLRNRSGVCRSMNGPIFFLSERCLSNCSSGSTRSAEIRWPQP